MNTILATLRFLAGLCIAMLAGFSAVVASTSDNLFICLGGGLIVFGCIWVVCKAVFS